MGQCPHPDTKSVLWVMGWLRAGAGTTLSSSLQVPLLLSAAIGKREDPPKKGFFKQMQGTGGGRDGRRSQQCPFLGFTAQSNSSS